MKLHNQYSHSQLVAEGYKHLYNIGKMELWASGSYRVQVDRDTRKVDRYYFLKENGEEIDL